jgi:outer membrane receptor protein involved in Fe transport
MNLVTVGIRMMLMAWIASSLLAAGPAAWGQETQETPESPEAEEAQEPEETADADRPFAETITVTVQKRDELLEEIPMSVTVLPGEALERERVEDFRDLVAVVPGLSIETTTPGVTRLSLRGINTGGVASTVGVYVADVPFGSSSGLANAAILSADFDTLDLDRIEVLRGPQGTLYGASSLGGVLKYVPNRPTTERYEGRIQGSLESVEDGDLGYSLAGVVNAPISDRFAVRANGYYRLEGGFIDSIGDHPIPSLTDPGIDIVGGTLVEEDLNQLDKTGVRLAALFEASDRFSLTLAAQAQRIESDAPHAIDVDPVTLEPLNRDPVQSRYHSQFSDVEYQVLSATFDWDLGGATLQSVTSYGTFEQEAQTDAAFATTLTGGLPLSSLVTLLFGDAAARPLSVIFPNQVTTDKTTQELRLVSPANDRFEWLIGAYYTEEDSEITQDLLAVEAGTDTVAGDIQPLADIALVSTYEEYALFANATWHVTPRFDLSFGGRASENDQVASQVSDGVLVGGRTVFDDARSSESPFTYSLSPRLELGERSSIYARVATGFRPGGPNVLPPAAPADTPSTYDSDRLTSYEVGLKTTSSGGGLSLDLAAYYLDWEDIQLLAVVNNFGINANGGTAVSQGAEITLGLRPTSGLLLSFNGAYTDAYLTQDTDPVVGGLDGDPLPWVPEWSFGLHGDYAWAVMGDWVAHAGGSVNYTGDRPADFGDRVADGSVREIDGYETLNLGAGLDFGQWSLELYGRNLTDAEGITSADTGGFLPDGARALGLIRPRSVGVAVALRW